MRKGWIAVAIVIAGLIGLGALFATTDFGPDRDWDDHQEVQTITRSDGTSETVTIEREGRDGPPFFFFFPLGFFLSLFLFFALMRWAFGGRGGPWNGGHGGNGGPMRQRFAEWHREEHERMKANGAES
jgi:hypothetical protein